MIWGRKGRIWVEDVGGVDICEILLIFENRWDIFWWKYILGYDKFNDNVCIIIRVIINFYF